MARNVTITFDNGAQHTYEGVPDSTTPESIQDRALRDFGNRIITNIDGGREGGSTFKLGSEQSPNMAPAVETTAARVAATNPQEALAAVKAVPAIAQPVVDTAKGLGKVAAATVNDIYQMGKIATQVTPGAVYDYLQHPIENTFRNYVDPVTGRATQTPGLLKSYMQGHPMAAKLADSSISSLAGEAGQYAKNVGAKLAPLGRFGSSVATGMLTGPENAVMLPYTMAAYEQEKIRANPRAPGLEYNPYAQVQRGEAATQGRAGAANQMRAVANQPFTGVSAQERAILEEDRMMRNNIRKKAYEKVMGPVVPGSF